MKGILFKPDMIRAIIEGRKTQTRRVIKPQPTFSKDAGFAWKGGAYGIGGDMAGTQRNFAKRVARYQVGEVVYIKEAFNLNALAGIGEKEHFILNYRSGGTSGWINMVDVNPKPPFKFRTWQSPLFMPQWAARYFIKITDVRAERVQEITEEAAVAEGITMNNTPWEGWYWMENIYSTDCPKIAYQLLWDSIDKAYPWESNPYVWVYTFEPAPQGKEDKG